MPKVTKPAEVTLWDSGYIQCKSSARKLIRPLCAPVSSALCDAISRHAGVGAEFYTGTSLTGTRERVTRAAFWGNCGAAGADVKAREAGL